MTTYITYPEDVVVDLLRVNITDPRSRVENSSVASSTASPGQTQVTLSSPTGSVSCVTAITIDSVAKTKWVDYHWDPHTQIVSFFNAFAGGEAISITYKYGLKNWIFSDKPATRAGEEQFPRISVWTVSHPGERLGNSDAPVQSSPYFQIDVWAKEGYDKTIGGRLYSGESLATYLAYKITQVLEENENDLAPVLYDYKARNHPKAAPFSQEYRAFHAIVEAQFSTLRAGRMEV